MSDTFDISDPECAHRGLLWYLKRNPVEESIEVAETFFEGFKFSVFIDSDDANDPAHQICLLTIINTASRISLQECSVQVFGVSDQPRNDNSGLSGTLRDAVREIGGTCEPPYDKGETLGIAIGKAEASDCRFCIRAAFDGWRGGIVPYKNENPFEIKAQTIPLGAILAAGLAVYECFRYHNKEGSAIGRRSKGVSLWNFSEKNWIEPNTSEPVLIDKISPVWFAGVGHLGQAYIWALGHLPFSDEFKKHQKITMQDGDCISRSNLSTSLLTIEKSISLPKVQACKEWLGNRGFCEIITEESYILPGSKIDFGESHLVCGFDSLTARRQTASKKSVLMIDGAIGAGPDDFQSIAMTVLPSDGIDPKSKWAETNSGSPTGAPKALEKLAAEGKINECGLETLNGRAVGFPFVGVVTSAIIISELLRRNLGGQCYKIARVDMRGLDVQTP